MGGQEGLAQLESLEQRRETSTIGRFRATSVKVMQDGVCENCTGAMLEPYSGGRHHGTPSGLSFIDPEELREICRELDRRRFQIHLHAVGDRAVRECLDALESARQAGPDQDNRHQIAHLDVVHPADVPRFASLGVIANLQALWARRDKEIVERKLPLLGRDREPHHFPFGALHRAGARLAMGSDWPVTDPNPLWAIYTAATRLGPPQDPHAVGDGVLTEPLEPAQALDLRVALDAYTAGSAYANHAEHEAGTIAAGHRADLVLLDRPILADLQEVSAARPVLTLVDGQAVHRED
ncbi:amidohydrolase [Nonomuraea thailandensis]